MAKKDGYEKSMKIDVPLIFKKVDGHMARFEMPVKAAKEGFVGNRTVDLDTRIFPPDFELSLYGVTGSVVIEATCKKK